MRKVRLAALLATALMCVLGAMPPSAFASHGEMVLFEAPGDLLGVPASFQAARLDQLQSLGVRALRVTLYWRDVAPMPNHRQRPSFNQANPAKYHWGEYDLLIDRAVALHWKVLLTVTGPVPNWGLVETSITKSVIRRATGGKQHLTVSSSNLPERDTECTRVPAEIRMPPAIFQLPDFVQRNCYGDTTKNTEH